MIKQILFFFIASILFVLFSPHFHVALTYLNHFYASMNHLIAPVFNQVGLGRIIHQVVLLVMIPVIIVGIPAAIYWLIKRETMPHLIAATWCIWLILVLSLLAH